MNLHEYQAKQVFAKYGLPVSQGIACDTADEAVAAAAATASSAVSHAIPWETGNPYLANTCFA